MLATRIFAIQDKFLELVKVLYFMNCDYFSPQILIHPIDLIFYMKVKFSAFILLSH